MNEIITNGYSIEQYIYEKLLYQLYGFEEYFYYKNDKYINDYKYIIKQLEKIRTNDRHIDENYKNAIIGWYISFKNLKRFIAHNNIAFKITNSCQLKCKHCYDQYKPRTNKNMTYEEFVYLNKLHQTYAKEFIHYNKNEQRFVYSIEGGEAILNKDLLKIIQYLNKQNICVTLLSNGIYIDDEVIDTIKKYPLNKIQISVDGLKESHDFIRGIGSFDKTIQTIKKLVKHDIKLNANFVYNSINYKDYIPLKTLLNNIGCSLTGCMRYVDIQNPFIRELNKEEMKSNKEYSFFNERPCIVGNQSIILENGDYNTCSKMNTYPISNYYTDTKEEFIRKVKLFTIRSRSVPVYCFDCKDVNICLGGQMCSSYHKFKRFNSEDTKCHLLNKKNITVKQPYTIDYMI